MSRDLLFCLEKDARLLQKDSISVLKNVAEELEKLTANGKSVRDDFSLPKTLPLSHCFFCLFQRAALGWVIWQFCVTKLEWKFAVYFPHQSTVSIPLWNADWKSLYSNRRFVFLLEIPLKVWFLRISNISNFLVLHGKAKQSFQVDWARFYKYNNYSVALL